MSARWWLIVASVVSAGLLAMAASAGAAAPDASGTWSVSNTNAPADSYSFVRVGTSDRYTVTNEYGFTAHDVVVPSSGATVTLHFTSPTTTDYFEMVATFKFPANGPATFRGTWKQFHKDGSPALSGKDRGVRSSRPQAHHLTVTFSPPAVDAAGTGVSTATITDLDESNEPVPDATIHIEPPLIYGEGKPPALVCDDSGRLVSPVRQSGGGFDGFSFDRTTDAAGQVHLTVFTGAVEGDWPLDALEKSKPGTERVFAGLTVGPSGQSTVLPTELPAILHAAGDSSLANFSTSAQRAALAWLAGPASAGLQGVAFAPIVGDNGNAGVVLFANAPAVRKQVMTYLASGGTPPSDLQAVVIDATLLRLLQVGTRIAGVQVKTPPQRFPSLEEWAKGGFIVIQDRELQSRGNDTRIPVPAHGQPHFGLAGATGNEDLLYGYGPVPPFAAGGALQAQFSRCTGVRFGTTVVPHSPVRLLATGPGGKTAGIDARGHAVATIPGAIVDHRGSKLAALHLPPGNFNLTVTGTGAGRATIVVSAPTHRSAQTRVFGFAVRRGERGTIPLTSRAAGGTMRWGGATLHAASGVGLTAHGLPAKLVHGRLAHLKITVTDQFGKRAPGISLAVSGSPVAHGLTAHSGASGVITLPIAPSRAGTLRVRLAGPGFATVTRALRVR